MSISNRYTLCNVLVGSAPGFTPGVPLGRDTRDYGSGVGNILQSVLHKLQYGRIALTQSFFSAPIGDNHGGALTRAERQTGLAPSVASEYLISLCTATPPKEARLEGEQERQQTNPINSGSRLAVSRRTRRSLKTRADKQSSVCASSSQGYTEIQEAIG
jgi:hypothetical protein